MVGINNMESKKENCTQCGKRQGVTKCDKCHNNTCSDCLTIMPVAESISTTMIQVLHTKCAPAKHLAKLNGSEAE